MTNSDFKIKIQEKLPLHKIEKGLFLFIYRATRIPPHLGIIFNGKLYDITLQGANNGEDAAEFLNTIIKKYTKTVFFEIKLPQFNTAAYLIEILSNSVKKYNKVSETTSCILPIKLFFQEAYKINTSQANFIFDLLPILFQHQFILNTYHLNLERHIIDNQFVLKTYTKEDILNCLQALNLLI